MKKKITFVITLLLVLAGLFAFAACKDKEELHVVSISATLADGTHYSVGDAFDTSALVIKAKLSDGTERDVTTTNTDVIRYDESELRLDKDGKFTAASAEGESFKLRVTYLNDFTCEVAITVEE